MDKENILKALAELRKDKERKFDESIDLIINLKDFDIKKNSINLAIEVPFKIKDARVMAFLTKQSSIIDSTTKNEFAKYKNKKQIKKLVRDYDFFISAANLMPLVASTFGKYLGPSGKMPSPQFGILARENEDEIKKIIEKVGKIIRIKTKEPSIKICIGKKSMKDEEIAENIMKVHDAILNTLPKKKENIRNIMIKFTMSNPVKL